MGETTTPMEMTPEQVDRHNCEDTAERIVDWLCTVQGADVADAPEPLATGGWVIGATLGRTRLSITVSVTP